MLPALDKIGARDFHLILLGVGLAATVLAISAVFLPGFKAYRSATKTVAILEETRVSNDDLDRQLEERRDNIEQLKFRLYGDMANLPLRQVESYVIGRLQDISWRNDVELISVKPTSGQQVQIFTEVLFNIELIGEYSNIYRWLWDAKNELGFIVVKEYEMRRRDNIDDNPRLVTEISLASYRAQE